VLAHQPSEAPAEGQPGNARYGKGTHGGSQTERLGFAVELSQQETGVGAGSAVRRIDANAAYGQVDRVTIVRDRRTDGPRGFGFVEMASSEEGNNHRCPEWNAPRRPRTECR